MTVNDHQMKSAIWNGYHARRTIIWAPIRLFLSMLLSRQWICSTH